MFLAYIKSKILDLYCQNIEINATFKTPRFKDRKKRRLGLLHPKQRSVFNVKVFFAALLQAVTSPPTKLLVYVSTS